VCVWETNEMAKNVMVLKMKSQMERGKKTEGKFKTRGRQFNGLLRPSNLSL